VYTLVLVEHEVFFDFYQVWVVIDCKGGALMTLVNWHTELKDWHNSLKDYEGETPIPLFNEPITCIDAGSLLVFHSDTPISHISAIMSQEDCDFALIQNQPDVIEGVISRRDVDKVIGQKGVDGDKVSAATLMETVSFCIEPDNTTIGEIVEKMSCGSCYCAIIVDRQAQPIFLVSPRSLLLTLIELLPGEVIMVGGA
jgi:hypothetical protein